MMNKHTLNYNKKSLLQQQKPRSPGALPRVIAVVGPTSSGKSAYAIALARHIGGEIISADSRQVYRGINLASGKVSRAEMRGVPHHLLSIADPKRSYSAARFVRDAQRVIKEILSRGNIPIICGGTGFYIDALLLGTTFPEVPPNPSLRKFLSKKSAPALFAELRKLDPLRAQTIDRHNPVRLIRAIEIARSLGKVPPGDAQPQYEVSWVGLDLPDAILRKRIETRVKERLRRGMVAEAKKLRAKGLSLRRMRELGLELRHLADLLEKKIDRSEFVPRLTRDIWRYAKRQRAWLRRNKHIRWHHF